MDKLTKIRNYVENMAPVVRAAILRSPEEHLKDEGFDKASYQHQQKLLALLDEPDYNDHEPLE